jgi:hypothetical protein
MDHLKFIEFLKISDEIHNELMKKHEERVPLILNSVVDIITTWIYC